MKTIDVITESYQDDSTQTETYAVNKYGEGLFTHGHDGLWKQHLGTGQFNADSPRTMMRKLRSIYNIEGCKQIIRMVRGSADGWDD